MNVKQLEAAAIRAHDDGVKFNQFWELYGDEAGRAVPRDRFNGFYRRLLCLVVAGDLDGTEPIGSDIHPLFQEPMPWEVDDAQATAISDTETQAKFQGLDPSPRSGSLEALPRS
jgi:hypothetical protein